MHIQECRRCYQHTHTHDFFLAYIEFWPTGILVIDIFLENLVYLDLHESRSKFDHKGHNVVPVLKNSTMNVVARKVTICRQSIVVNLSFTQLFELQVCGSVISPLQHHFMMLLIKVTMNINAALYLDRKYSPSLFRHLTHKQSALSCSVMLAIR